MEFEGETVWWSRYVCYVYDSRNHFCQELLMANMLHVFAGAMRVCNSLFRETLAL